MFSDESGRSVDVGLSPLCFPIAWQVRSRFRAAQRCVAPARTRTLCCRCSARMFLHATAARAFSRIAVLPSFLCLSCAGQSAASPGYLGARNSCWRTALRRTRLTFVPLQNNHGISASRALAVISIAPVGVLSAPASYSHRASRVGGLLVRFADAAA